MTRSRKIPTAQAGIEPRICRSRGGHLNHSSLADCPRYPAPQRCRRPPSCYRPPAGTATRQSLYTRRTKYIAQTCTTHARTHTHTHAQIHTHRHTHTHNHNHTLLLLLLPHHYRSTKSCRTSFRLSSVSSPREAQTLTSLALASPTLRARTARLAKGSSND